MKSSTLLSILGFPTRYLRAVLAARKALRKELAKSSDDVPLLRSATTLAQDLLPLAVRFANTAIITFPTEAESTHDQLLLAQLSPSTCCWRCRTAQMLAVFGSMMTCKCGEKEAIG